MGVYFLILGRASYGVESKIIHSHVWIVRFADHWQKLEQLFEFAKRVGGRKNKDKPEIVESMDVDEVEKEDGDAAARTKTETDDEEADDDDAESDKHNKSADEEADDGDPASDNQKESEDDMINAVADALDWFVL